MEAIVAAKIAVANAADNVTIARKAYKSEKHRLVDVKANLDAHRRNTAMRDYVHMLEGDLATGDARLATLLAAWTDAEKEHAAAINVGKRARLATKVDARVERIAAERVAREERPVALRAVERATLPPVAQFLAAQLAERKGETVNTDAAQFRTLFRAWAEANNGGAVPSDKALTQAFAEYGIRSSHTLRNRTYIIVWATVAAALAATHPGLTPAPEVLATGGA